MAEHGVTMNLTEIVDQYQYLNQVNIKLLLHTVRKFMYRTIMEVVGVLKILQEILTLYQYLQQVNIKLQLYILIIY